MFDRANYLLCSELQERNKLYGILFCWILTLRGWCHQSTSDDQQKLHFQQEMRRVDVDCRLGHNWISKLYALICGAHCFRRMNIFHFCYCKYPTQLVCSFVVVSSKMMRMGRNAMYSMRTAFRKFQKVGAVYLCLAEPTNYILCYDDFETAANIFLCENDVITSHALMHANMSCLLDIGNR